MSEAKQLGGAGLRGQVAGKTALSTVGKEGSGLTYRGYAIEDLAENCSFEEVAYLLLQGQLPKPPELAELEGRLRGLRELPRSLREVLERIPRDAHPMDVLRTGCSFLGDVEPESDFGGQLPAALRMLAVFPTIICYWYRYSHDGVRVAPSSEDPSIAAHFLRMLSARDPDPLHERVMNVSLILYAEHEFNASTFAARVCASTLSDLHSCITAAIGTLRGPLHGGANEAAMAMIERFESPDDAEAALLEMLRRKEKIMGFGHAVYRESDPRNAIIKRWADQLARTPAQRLLYDISLRCEKVMWREKKLFCNADFFHASAYNSMGIPTKLFTPIFVMSRVAGWCAHVFEQRADNRIIRPSAEYIGEGPRRVVPIHERVSA